MSDYLDDTHQRIIEFAEEFIDDDEERETFVDGLMERRGYVRESRWAAPDPGGAGGGRQPLLKGGQPKPRQPGGQGGGGSYFRKGR